MAEYNIKVLKFREELIKLLKKYDCEISGTSIDDFIKKIKAVGGKVYISF